ncbi:hypothetical protein ACYATO_00060 [Lactobacillaceae bacterium Melli_B3]
MLRRMLHADANDQLASKYASSASTANNGAQASSSACLDSLHQSAASVASANPSNTVISSANAKIDSASSTASSASAEASSANALASSAKSDAGCCQYRC